MSRKTPKSKSNSTTAAASAPKSKAKGKPSTSASSNGAKAKRAKRSISIKELAERVTTLENGNSTFRHELKVLLVEINLISEWIKDKFGIELINKSSEIYKHIHNSKNDIKELTDKLSVLSAIKVAATEKSQESEPFVNSVTVPVENEKGSNDRNDHEDQKKERISNAGRESEEIKKEVGQDQESRNHELEANNNQGESGIVGVGNVKPSLEETTSEPRASDGRPETPPPPPRILTSFEKSRLALYQRTLQERRKSNAAASKEPSKARPTANQMSLSPPPPKITRIDAEPETSTNQLTSSEDDNVDHGDPPVLEHGDSGSCGSTPSGFNEHHLEVIPSPGIGRFQKRGRCVHCSKKKVERKSRFWCALCKKSLCQSPCFEEYHRVGISSPND